MSSPTVTTIVFALRAGDSRTHRHLRAATRGIDPGSSARLVVRGRHVVHVGTTPANAVGDLAKILRQEIADALDAIGDAGGLCEVAS